MALSHSSDVFSIYLHWDQIDWDWRYLLLLLLSRRCLFSLSTRKNERGTDREKSQTINLSSGWNKWVALFRHAFILHPKRNLLFTFIFINTNIFADSYYYQNLGRLLNPGIGIYNRSISSISSTCIFCQNSSQNPIWCDWRTRQSLIGVLQPINISTLSREPGSATNTWRTFLRNFLQKLSVN